VISIICFHHLMAGLDVISAVRDLRT